MAQRNYLQSARKRVLAKLGKSRGTQVITLIHRQETISFPRHPSGPLHRYRRQRTGFEGYSQSGKGCADRHHSAHARRPGSGSHANRHGSEGTSRQEDGDCAPLRHERRNSHRFCCGQDNHGSRMPLWVPSIRSWEMLRAAIQPHRSWQSSPRRRSMRSMTRHSSTPRKAARLWTR